MKQPSRQNHRNNRNNKGGRRSSGGGGGGAHSANRVYDSSGPEGKVRGTAQQIIDKYTSLARDAQTSGESVLAENFFQHAEHYQRILTTIQAAEAEERERRQAAQQAEQERRAEQQARQQQNRANAESDNSNPPRDRSASRGSEPGNPSESNNPSDNPRTAETPMPVEGVEAARKPVEAMPAAGETTEDTDGPALVETPEAKLAEQRDGESRRPVKRARVKPVEQPSEEDAVSAPAAEASNETVVAEEAPKLRRGRPRKTPPPPAAEEADAAS